jgi:hypothetical protein
MYVTGKSRGLLSLLLLTLWWSAPPGWLAVDRAEMPPQAHNDAGVGVEQSWQESLLEWWSSMAQSAPKIYDVTLVRKRTW